MTPRVGSSWTYDIVGETQSLLVLVEFCGHLLNLGTKLTVLAVGLLGCFLEFLDFSLQILQVLLLTLAERTLGRTVLSLSFLSTGQRLCPSILE